MILTHAEKVELMEMMRKYASLGLAGRDPIDEVLCEVTPDTATNELHKLAEAQEWLERNLPMGWKLHE